MGDVSDEKECIPNTMEIRFRSMVQHLRIEKAPEHIATQLFDGQDRSDFDVQKKEKQGQSANEINTSGDKGHGKREFKL